MFLPHGIPSRYTDALFSTEISEMEIFDEQEDESAEDSYLPSYQMAEGLQRAESCSGRLSWYFCSFCVEGGAVIDALSLPPLV
jgi:hypothetical protein